MFPPAIFIATETNTRQLYPGFLTHLLKILILGLCLWFIGAKLSVESVRIQFFTESFPRMTSFWGILTLLLVFGMMLLNWGLEICKWQLLMNSSARISMRKATYSVLAGLCLGFVTPRSIGDYAGRMMFLDNKHRSCAVVPTALSRLAQLLPTLTFGIAGCIFLLSQGQITWHYPVSAITCVILLGLGLIRYPHVRRWIKLTVIKQLFTAHIDVGIIKNVMALSFARYTVFSVQFLLIFLLVGVEGSVGYLLLGITWVFLAKSVFPSFNFLSDLGIREASAIFFFETVGYGTELVLVASLLIWVINIFLPTLAGLILITTSKLRLW